MHDARVLVVDDSAAMRALFSDLLEQSRNVRVVGTAANVNEAREQIELLRPNVLTLDVEMPGMSGIEFLEEIMDSNPMPVVMLSSLTQSGAVTTLRAYELGAVECFPKPLKVSPEQFAKNVSKLGKIVLAAANSNVRQKRPHHVNRWHKEQFHWNGTLIAINASMGGFEALTDLFAAYPPNCPPTVVVLQAEPEVANAFIQRLNTELACTVTPAKTVRRCSRAASTSLPIRISTSCWKRANRRSCAFWRESRPTGFARRPTFCSERSPAPACRPSASCCPAWGRTGPRAFADAQRGRRNVRAGTWQRHRARGPHRGDQPERGHARTASRPDGAEAIKACTEK
jgi:CheY-like chemotaxis protein